MGKTLGVYAQDYLLAKRQFEVAKNKLTTAHRLLSEAVDTDADACNGNAVPVADSNTVLVLEGRTTLRSHGGCVVWNFVERTLIADEEVVGQ